MSTIPASLILSMADSRTMQSNDAETMMARMTQQGMLSGVMTLVPTLRLIGLVMLASSGLALVKQRRKWGYSTIVKDATVAACLGALAMGIAAWSVATQGVWSAQVKEASRASVRIAGGGLPAQQATARPSMAPAVNEDAPIRPRALTPGLAQPDLVQDRPFPNNGTFERSLALQGKVASLTFANRSQNNAIVVWYYNMNDGKGDQEALKLYLKAGQSSSVDIPAFDYRMAVYEAAPSYGLDRGFGPSSKPTDLGLIDLKTPATALIQQPMASYSGYGIFRVQPGVVARK
jgi:hypothetical protein